MQLLIPILMCFLTLTYSIQAEVIKREGNGFLEQQQSQRVLHVKGSPYEMGFQHGKLLKDLIEKNVASFIDTVNPNPDIASRIELFQQKVPTLMHHVPLRFQEEMQGVADGSGVPLKKIIALNLFPEMFHCTGITVSDEATAGGDLYHVRVLDYSVGKSLQNSAVLIVAQPQEGHAFLNVSYAGFIGSVTGMNDQHIAMGEIGGWGYGLWNGMPMSFLFREVLEKASSLEQAKQLLSETPRTCEYYYVVSDGKDKSSVGVYATDSQIHFFEPGTGYTLLAPVGLPDEYGTNGDNDKFCLTNSSVQTSPYQTLFYDSKKRLSALHHQQPEHCVLLTGFSRPERYPLIVQHIMDNYGKIDERFLQQMIKRPVSLESNLHNAIFQPSQLKVWISHAGPNNEPACDQPYAAFSLPELLAQK